MSSRNADEPAEATMSIKHCATPDHRCCAAVRFTFVLLGIVSAVAALAQDSNVLYTVADIENRLLRTPVEVLDIEQARPSIENDRSARVLLTGAAGEEPIQVKWKPVHPGARGFNNEPRYELAAYRLQSLFLDEAEYVVPPTVLRSKTHAEYQALMPAAEPTLRGTSSVLFLLSYWVQNVTTRDPFRPDRFESDPAYARHWANLNILTHLIDHKDGNVGNLLISTDPENPRVFAVDNDVAFASAASDRGAPWARLQVDRLPGRTVERLRGLTEQDLKDTLGVVAEFVIVDGHLWPSAPGGNLHPRQGVRIGDGHVQLGLTEREIRDVARRLQALLRRIDRGRIELF
jgi:hypothetical protein